MVEQQKHLFMGEYGTYKTVKAIAHIKDSQGHGTHKTVNAMAQIRQSRTWLSGKGP